MLHDLGRPLGREELKGNRNGSNLLVVGNF
jgi:hypothetical protein